jgi:hypothetical protein
MRKQLSFNVICFYFLVALEFELRASCLLKYTPTLLMRHVFKAGVSFILWNHLFFKFCDINLYVYAYQKMFPLLRGPETEHISQPP